MQFNQLLTNKYLITAILISILNSSTSLLSQNKDLQNYNTTWTTPSINASESMPCGGGDIGLNVWVEKGDLLIYMAQSGTFDENNAMPKAGRIRVTLSPNILSGKSFKQELQLNDGDITIDGQDNSINAKIKIWVDVFNPQIHIDINSSSPIIATATYESWRHTDYLLKKRESNANSYKWAAPDTLKTLKDNICFEDNSILFYHQNKATTVFDKTVNLQGMDSVKAELFNPLHNLIFGGMMSSKEMIPAGNSEGIYANTPFKGWKLKSNKPLRSQSVIVTLIAQQTPDIKQWQQNIAQQHKTALEKNKNAHFKTIEWWNSYWQRSFIYITKDKAQHDDNLWKIGRNYQLMRYMLGCNAYGSYPTKFNGGLFTVDPCFTDTSLHATPDFRNWGGGTFTAQNQRLVYWPMLKSGDSELMKPQFDFYTRLLKNAELRSQIYWQHNGACFTEQMENFGLPNPSEYGWKRPATFDKGMEYNAWLEYEWDTVLEFCQMMIETHRYNQSDISLYIPFIESCLTFFDEHYQMLASQRGRKKLDGNNQLVLYPGSACETYKMSYNSTSTIAALQTVTQSLLNLPADYLNETQRTKWTEFLKRIPPISYRQFEGHTTIAPAKLWERINNVESPQLYPVYPWGIYGIGKPGLDTAINTFKYDTDVIKFRSHIGWKQDNIWAARLGLTSEATELMLKKLGDSGRRFPAFWGPGYDWVPDHNWGGSGMIGLQEMLMQTVDNKIYILPAWPSNVDVHFKLHAPGTTTVEVILKDGKIQKMEVLPKERQKNIVVMLEQQIETK